MSDGTYKVKRYFKRLGKVESEETGVISGPEAFGMAHRLAVGWKNDKNNRTVILLRADSDGVNAGKYFTHLILK